MAAGREAAEPADAAGAVDTAEAVELVYRPTREDVDEALRARGRFARRRWLPRVGRAVAAPFAGVLMLGLLEGEAELPTAAGGVIGALAGAAVTCAAGCAQARILHRFPRHHGEFRVRADDAGLHVATAGAGTAVGWDLLPHYLETANLFVALSRDKGAVGFAVMPKCGIEPPGDTDRPRALLDRHAVRVDGARTRASSPYRRRA